MKTTASTTTETTMTKRNGKVVKAYIHTCTLECGHVETRTDGGFGGANVPPRNLKCSACGR